MMMKKILRNGSLLETFGQLQEKVNNEPLVLDAVPKNGASADMREGLPEWRHAERLRLPDVVGQVRAQEGVNVVAECLQLWPRLGKRRLAAAFLVQQKDVILHAIVRQLLAIHSLFFLLSSRGRVVG